MSEFAQQQTTESAFAPTQHAPSLGVLELLPGIGPMIQLAKGAGGAVSHLFDGLFDHTDGKPNGKAAAMDTTDAGHLLDRQYLHGDDINVDQNVQMGNLDAETKQQRLAALSKLNQVNPDDSESDHYCGPAALLAAAVYAKGGKGVDAIID